MLTMTEFDGLANLPTWEVITERVSYG